MTTKSLLFFFLLTSSLLFTGCNSKSAFSISNLDGNAVLVNPASSDTYTFTIPSEEETEVPDIEEIETSAPAEEETETPPVPTGPKTGEP